ncbi:MAG: thiamine-binding protein [Clostridiales bacterium]|jgi:uncharacterized protein YqgV (UPF0045/DUF77 family)|nr:thiamine-binding protein [Clostridiales bacterium]
MPNANVSLQVLPMCGGGKEKVYSIVDEVIAYIASHGVKYVVCPHETTMEGDFDSLMEIVKGAQRVCVEAGAHSVISHVKIEFDPGGGASIEEKTGKYAGA